MIRNYLTIAIRSFLRYRFFALTNLIGLAVGLAVLILTQILVGHESNHDSFFPNHERIYAIYTAYQPEADLGVSADDGTYFAVRPLLAGNVPEIEASARSLWAEVVAQAENGIPFYQTARFVDPAFLKIFAFDYLAGEAEGALDQPNEIILSESAARRYFGTPDAVGRTLTLDSEMDVRVAAVIRDLPKNSHFTTSLLPPSLFDPKFEMLAPLDAYRSLMKQEPDENWSGINPWEPTYLLLRENAEKAAAERGLRRIYETHFPEDTKKTVLGLGLRPLTELSQYIWNATGLPVPLSVQILGVLVLGIAIVNYSILANAQAVARTREIGIRKSLGAHRSHLFAQFLTESVLLSVLALVIALAIVALLLPRVGAALDQNIPLFGDAVFARFGLLAAAAVGTGLLAGLYPAFRISQMPSVAGVLNETRGGSGSGSKRLTGIFIGLQFLVATVLGGLVLVITAQNAHMQAAAGDLFENDRLVVLERVQDIESDERRRTLMQQLRRLDDVESVTATTQIPYAQGKNLAGFARRHGDDAASVSLLQFWNAQDFFATFEIPIVAGRSFSQAFASDRLAVGEAAAEQDSVNIVVNETAVHQLGLGSPEQAVGETIYFADSDRTGRAHRIVGVARDINYLGFNNRIWPMVFFMRPEAARFVAVRLREGAPADVAAAIDETWRQISPAVPVVRNGLTTYFEQIFAIFLGIGRVLAPLAGVALLLSLAGLFGLAAYSTERRAKEISIRKVFGGSAGKLVRLMVWQMSRPVLVSLAVAIPLVYLAANLYLDFFSDRIAALPLYVGATALAAIVMAWMTVIGHAMRAANRHPAAVLREE